MQMQHTYGYLTLLGCVGAAIVWQYWAVPPQGSRAAGTKTSGTLLAHLDPNHAQRDQHLLAWQLFGHDIGGAYISSWPPPNDATTTLSAAHTLILIMRQITTLQEQCPHLPHHYNIIVYGGVAGLHAGLTSKNGLYGVLHAALSSTQLSLVLPPTWRLTEVSELMDLERQEQEDPGGRYIFKSYKHLQDQVLITRSPAEELRRLGTPYIVCQRVLDDPYLFDGIKVTLRFYLLLVYRQGLGLTAYGHNDGMVYYAIKSFSPNSTDPEVEASAALEADPRYPTTLMQLKQRMDTAQWDRLWRTAWRSIATVVGPFVAGIAAGNADDGCVAVATRLVILGVDTQADAALDTVRVLEVNLDPHLGTLEVLRTGDEARWSASVQGVADMYVGAFARAGALRDGNGTRAAEMASRWSPLLE